MRTQKIKKRRCKFCKKVFIVKHDRARHKQIYCSLKCINSKHWIERNCPVCKKIFKVNSNYARNGVKIKRKYCSQECFRKKQRSEIINETENIYGDYRVIERAEDRIGSRGKKAVAWKCKCVRCGKEKIILGHQLRDKWRKTCCHPKYRLRYPGEANFNALFRNYKAGAKARRINWNLSREEVKELTKENCTYCGTKPQTVIESRESKGAYVYNGIDRVNNDEGYTKENCAPCCSTCNWMKLNKSKKFFLKHIEKILVYQNSKREVMPDNMLRLEV